MYNVGQLLKAVCCHWDKHNDNNIIHVHYMYENVLHFITLFTSQIKQRLQNCQIPWLVSLQRRRYEHEIHSRKNKMKYQLVTSLPLRVILDKITESEGLPVEHFLCTILEVHEKYESVYITFIVSEIAHSYHNLIFCSHDTGRQQTVYSQQLSLSQTKRQVLKRFQV